MKASPLLESLVNGIHYDSPPGVLKRNWAGMDVLNVNDGAATTAGAGEFEPDPHDEPDSDETDYDHEPIDEPLRHSEDEPTTMWPPLSGKGSPVPPEHDPVVVGARADVDRADQLLLKTQEAGTKALVKLAKAAMSRLLANPEPGKATEFFNEEELNKLGDVLAANNSAADLLGRARVRLRMQQAEDLAKLGVRRFAEQPTKFEAFAEPIKPFPPLKALTWFKKLVPTIGVSPIEWASGQAANAFSLARVTSETLLKRIQDVIWNSLATGKVKNTPDTIEEMLTSAGVSIKNPQYPEMVFRTNSMTALNKGAMEEMQDPDVAEFFPVWRYAAIVDSRSRPEHAERNGLYYPNDTEFADIRGREAKDACNCRCTPVPVSKYEWRDLQSQGATVQTFAENAIKNTMNIAGVPVGIEYPRGSWRSGTAPTGGTWKRQMRSHYGRIRTAIGADGEDLDAFVGPALLSDRVFVVDQLKRDGNFDEHKVLLGYKDLDSAKAGYLANYPPGWRGLGHICAFSPAEFRRWLSDGPHKVPLAPINVWLQDIRQEEAYDCGAAALTAVLDHFVKPRPERAVMEAAGTKENTGTPPPAMVGMLTKAGLTLQAGRMSWEDLCIHLNECRPVICVMQLGSGFDAANDQDGHYVTALGWTTKELWVQDPVTGRRAVPKDEWMANWHDKDFEARPYVHYGIAVWRE